MNKGFTLIELLAVIVILAIILLIAVPQVLSVIEDSKYSAYKSTKEMVLKAAELYMASNMDELPNNIGSTVEIPLADLETDYIEAVKGMGNTCSGYVLVTKNTEDSYSYDAEINCYETINNSTEDDLVLYYTFDNNVYDYTNNGYNGTVVGSPNIVPGIKGNAYNFETGEYINIPYGNAYSFANDFTVSMWVKPSTVAGNSIFFSNDYNSLQRLYIGIAYGKYDIGIETSGWYAGEAVIEATTDWVFVTLVMNSGTASLYINGVLDFSKTYSTYSSPSDFKAAVSADSISSYQFLGSMDELKIYSRALSADEVMLNYRGY